MSSQFNFQATIFEDIPNGKKTYGYRVYDDCFQEYYNLWDSIPDGDLPFFEKIIDDFEVGDMGDNVMEIIYYLLDNESGCNINGSWYDYDEIKPILNKNVVSNEPN